MITDEYAAAGGSLQRVHGIHGHASLAHIHIKILTSGDRSSLCRPRSSVSADILATQAASMAPSRKRKAMDVGRYECFNCAMDKPSKQFPDFNLSPDCEHLINTCKTCLRKWTESSIEDANFKTVSVPGGDKGAVTTELVWGVGCPQCGGVMRAVNVESATTKKVFKRRTNHAISFVFALSLLTDHQIRRVQT